MLHAIPLMPSSLHIASMKNPVACLPVEILSAIANHLSHHDRSSCCNVDRQWYIFFRRFLFRSISLKSRKRYESFLQYMQHNSPGQWVRKVRFHEGVSTLEELWDICPFIDVLDLQLTGQQLIQIPMPLHHLTLDYSNCDNYYDQLPVNVRDTRMPSIERTLVRMPALRSLSLIGIYKALRVEHLNSIHVACPTLTELALEVDFLCHPLPEQPEKRGTLRMLSIRTRKTTLTTEWVQYLLSRYPHLKRLAVGDAKTGPYDVILKSTGVLLDTILDVRSALMRFIPELQRSLQLQPYDAVSDLSSAVSAAPIDLFEIRLNFHDRQITQLHLHGDAPFPHSFNIDLLLNCLPCLTRLHATSVCLESTMRTASHHPLQTLHLEKCWVADSVLDAIIQRCPRLSQLALNACSVLLLQSRFALRMPNHTMRSIVLKDVSLTDYLGAFDTSIQLIQLHLRNKLPQWLIVKKELDHDSYISIQCHSLGQLIVN